MENYWLIRFLIGEGINRMDETTKRVSRRQAVGFVGMGLATAATGSSIAQTTSAPQAGSPPAPIAKDDPRSKYPKPPFQEQTQPWPGLASKMNPKPDHGETSYRGSGRLAGRKALITGGDSIPDSRGSAR
jgi:hypothetical protein